MRDHVVKGLGLLLACGTVWGQQYLIRTAAGGGLPATPVVATSIALETTSSVATDGAGNIYFTTSNSVLKYAAGSLTVVAGSSTIPGYSGDRSLAASAQLNQPWGLATDGAGNLYIADSGNNVIRMVVASTGIITTVAGNGTPGYGGDNTPATSAQLGHPRYVAADSAGNLYITDSDNHVVRKVTVATGVITTVAGNGTAGYSGDNNPATSVPLSPNGLAVDGAGNLYIADSTHNVVRMVTAATGMISTLAGNGTAGASGDNTPAIGAELASPASVGVDAQANVFIADSGNLRIRKVTAATGVITTVAGGGTDFFTSGSATAAQLTAVQGIAVDGAGDLFIPDGYVLREVVAATNSIATLAGNGNPGFAGAIGNGGPATSAQFNGVTGVATDAAGNFYIADNSNYAIRKVTAATGIIATIAGNGLPGNSGDGGPATSARLTAASGLAADVSGNVYFSDGFVVRKVTAATGVISIVAGNGTSGNTGNNGPATSAELANPTGVAVDSKGNLYIADAASNVIRKVTVATGIITTVAGNGTAGYSGDHAQATSAAIQPTGVAVDSAGNIYIADLTHGVVREVTVATGVINTVAGSGQLAYSGDGAQAASAGLAPQAVAVDGSGNLYIADYFSTLNPCGKYCNGITLSNERVRKVTAATGIITTVAGTGAAGYSGDGGLGTNAQIDNPAGVAVDANGNVYIADSGNNAVRLLTPEAASALLSISNTNSAGFARGEAGAVYTVMVSNATGTGSTSGTVTVTEIVPTGLTLASITGSGWSCSGAVCTRSDVLAAGSSYPAITVTVNVAADAPAQVTNQVTVSGGGSTTSSASDLTAIGGMPAPPAQVAPANGVTGVLVAPTLTWDAASGATSYDVYFGTLSTPPLAGNTTATTYSPATLLSGTTYYWQIVATNGIGSASSPVWSFTTGAPVVGAVFVPVTPCRVVDTRGTFGPFGGPFIAGGGMRTFTIPQSGCNIPAGAVAYSLNVTAVPAGPLSFLTLWPAGEPRPGVSTLNSFSGIVAANAAIVPAGQGGAVNVYASNQTDVILDINGYFASTSAANGSSFYTAAPCRVADTRNATGPFGGPTLGAGQTKDIPVPTGACGSFTGATAYSFNVTAIPATSVLSYLTAWPTGATQPYASTLNSWTGKVVANAALVPAGTNGSVSVFVTNPADVVLDVNGYFGAPGGAGALTFYPVTPCRVADTRNANGPFGGPTMTADSMRSFAIPASGCYVPPAAAAYSLNITVVPEGVLPYLTAWAAGAGQPFVSTLNSFDGSVVANAAIVPAGTDGAISVYVTNSTDVIVDLNGYFAP